MGLIKYSYPQIWSQAEELHREDNLRNMWSADDRSDECNNEAKCPNCSGSHCAFSKYWPKWLIENRVQHRAQHT